jgi:pimeloyl-ACP methyl ester carboxylesterase
MDALSTVATLIFYDPRGTGRSSRLAPSEMTLDVLVDDLETIRKHAGVSKWWL